MTTPPNAWSVGREICEVSETPISRSSLHQAVLDFRPWTFQSLLLNQRDQLDQLDELQRTPLMAAVMQGNVPAVELLLEAGAQVSIPEANGETVLMNVLGSFVQCSQIVRLFRFKPTLWSRLVNYQLSNGDNALLVAIRRGNHSLVRALVGFGIEIPPLALEIALEPTKSLLKQMTSVNLSHDSVVVPLRSLDWPQLVIPRFRVGVIPYYEYNEQKYYLLGQDFKSGDLSDFGGSFNPKSDGNHIKGALRELREETRNVLIWTPKLLLKQNATVVYNISQRMLIIFCLLPTKNINVVEYFNGVPSPEDREMSSLLWIPEGLLADLVSGQSIWINGQPRGLYQRVRRLLKTADLFSTRYSVYL